MKNSTIKHGFYLQLQEDIDRIDQKADGYRALYYVFRIGLITLASAITVASGWNWLAQKIDVVDIILFLGALSTAVTAIDTLLQIETKKNTYRLMLVELREIRSEFVYYHEYQNADLETVLRDKLFPKYQSTMAYARSLVEKDSEKEETESAQPA